VRSDGWTLGAVVVASVVVGGGGVYLLTRHAASSATSSGQTGSTGAASSGYVGSAGPGPNRPSSGSTPSGSTTGGSTASGSASSGSTTSGSTPNTTPPSSGGTPNASGGTVTLIAPSAIQAGDAITLLAQASGMTSPVYQFWWKMPGSSTWDQSGHYAATARASVPATGSGTAEAIVYARPASAPDNELQAGDQATYEANSGVVTIQVS